MLIVLLTSSSLAKSTTATIIITYRLSPQQHSAFSNITLGTQQEERMKKITFKAFTNFLPFCLLRYFLKNLPSL